MFAGVNLKTVHEILGKKTIAMTARYAHFAPTHKIAGAVDHGSSRIGFAAKWQQLAANTKNCHEKQKTE